MRSSSRQHRLLAASLAAGALVLAIVAVPVLGQASRTDVDQVAGLAAPPSEKPGKGPKASRAPEQQVTLSGTVGTRTDAVGKTTYTLTAGSTVYDLQAGPPWFWGEKHPLAPFVGKTVSIGGMQAEGSTAIDVSAVDGKSIRDAGKPPWAGGWKVVGEGHPGWSQWKADKAAARGEKGQGRPSWAGPKNPEPSPGD